MHASQWRRLRLRTGPPHIAHGAGFFARPSTCGGAHSFDAYGRACEVLRGVCESDETSGLGRAPRTTALADRLRGSTLPLASASRKVCVRSATTGRRHSRQCGRVSASSWVNGAATRHTPLESSTKSRAVNTRSSSRSRRNASTSGRTGSIASSANESRLRWSAWRTPSVGSSPAPSRAMRVSDSSSAYV